MFISGKVPMTSNNYSKSDKNTPLKSAISHPSKFCRLCKTVIASGRPRIHLFGPKSRNENLVRRLTVVLDAEVHVHDGLSEYSCQKCYREFLKHEKVIQQTKQLDIFRETYKRSTQEEIENFKKSERQKRCNKDSPGGIKKQRSSVQSRSTTPIARRILLPKRSNNESPVQDRSFIPLEQHQNQGLIIDTCTKTEVHVNFPSRKVVKTIKNDVDAKIIRQLSYGEYKYAANAIWTQGKLKKELVNKMQAEIGQECQNLCSTKSPSMLRKCDPQSLSNFSEKEFEEELKLRSPVLHSCLTTAMGNNNNRPTAPTMTMAASILLKHRCPQMSAQAYRYSIGVLWHSGAKKQGFLRSNRWGVSISHSMTLSKLDEMGIDFDRKLKGWKQNLESHFNSTNMLLETKQLLSEKNPIEFIPPGFSTTDIGGLDLSFPTLPSHSAGAEEGAPKVTTSLSTHNIKDDLYSAALNLECTPMENNETNNSFIKEYLAPKFHEADIENMFQFIENELPHCHYESLDASLIDTLVSKHEIQKPPTYQIIGDNIDFHVKVKHMSSERQNKSIHWFGLNAIQDRVLGLDLPDDKPIKNILEMENIEFLPSITDNEDLLHDLIPLCARIAIEKLPAFQCFKDVKVFHIPHQYSHIMKQKSAQEPLGILFKNENLNDEMIDILQAIHDNYIPVTVTQETTEDGYAVASEVAEQLFFGGDELTDERARNAVDARGDGDSLFERLEGVIPKVEDWHAIRLVYQIMYDILYHPNSANDVGSMCSNMNVTNNINAKTKNVLDNFNYCKDFVKTETEAFVVAAFMAHFKMTSYEGSIDIPPLILNGTKQARVKWLHQHVKEMLETFIMTRQNTELEELIEGVTLANQPSEPKVFLCRCCGKSYVYKKCRDRHEAQLHPDFTEPHKETCEDKDNPKEKPEQDKEDYIYNYACARLGLGLLLHNFDDAVKEGDGKRIIRCWKFLLLIFKCYNHNKYALASLQLLANINAMLTPRKAHSLIWNRTVNNKGGKGKNISLDLRMEHLVHLHKEMLSNLGVNLTEECALRCSRAVKPVEELLRNADEELLCKRPSGKHTTTRSQKDFELIVNELHSKGKVFQNTPADNRQYECFPNFKKTLVNELNYNAVNNWINQHKKQWSKKGK